MNFPKYSCSDCGKPSRRKWNLARHISLCHSGIGHCVSNWDFPGGSYARRWNTREQAVNHKENYHYMGSELVRRFLSFGNESLNIEPMPDYQHVFAEEYVKELARMAASLSGSINPPTQNATSFPFSPKINPSQTNANYNVGPAAAPQIFGFRGFVCDKCLKSSTHYVAFPEKGGQPGRLEERHFCDPAEVAVAGELVDKFGLFRFLHDKIPMIIKQRVDSWTGNKSYLVTVKLPSHPEENIKLHNPADTANPAIVFQYSKQTQVTVQLTNKNNNKSDYMIRAITQGKTLLRDEELTDLLQKIRNATFGIFKVRHDNTYSMQSELQQQPYFVYIR
jgi:hypothetical protein